VTTGSPEVGKRTQLLPERINAKKGAYPRPELPPEQPHLPIERKEEGRPILFALPGKGEVKNKEREGRVEALNEGRVDKGGLTGARARKGDQQVANLFTLGVDVLNGVGAQAAKVAGIGEPLIL